jgi:hypothetical protein
VATGVRGLSEEDLKNPKPNPRELERLDQFSVSRDEARSFAESARLRDQQVEYLAVP